MTKPLDGMAESGDTPNHDAALLPKRGGARLPHWVGGEKSRTGKRKKTCTWKEKHTDHLQVDYRHALRKWMLSYSRVLVIDWV